jgi:phage portal protein BeeE
MIGFPLEGGLVPSGVSGTTALGLSSVWRCLDILSNGVSQLEWQEVRGNLELPNSRIVNQPESQRTRREWTSIVVSTLALYDVCYLLPVGGYDSEGVPLGLWYLQPNLIMPKAVEARKQQVADIGRYFGIPTHILNSPQGDTETYSNTESGNQDLVRYTLQNYIGAIEDAISSQLPGGRGMKMDTWRLRSGTQLAQAQSFQLALGNKAWMTPDEVREMNGLPPVEDPDELNPPKPAPVIAGGAPNARQE